MPGMPAGTVTFLLTDIERSTSVLQRLGDADFAKVLTEHRQLLSTACRQEGGQEIDIRKSLSRDWWYGCDSAPFRRQIATSFSATRHGIPAYGTKA
jgi:class 3 adenylate cyclase